MGKKQRKRDARIATVEPQLAERHGFDPGGLLGHDTTYAVNVTESVSLSVDVVFACVRIIADLVADAFVGEYRDTERLPSSRIVIRPMQSVTRRTWLWQLTAILALYSGGWLRRLGRDTEGVPLSLVPYAPTRVNRIDDTWYLDGVEISREELIWVPRMTFPTVTRELASLLRLARDTIAAAWAASSYSADFWQAGGAPSWYLTTDQALTGTEADAIAERAAEKRAANPGRPMVFGKGSKPAVLTADLAGAGAGAAADRLGAAIARQFGVPAWLVNVPTMAGSLVYANSAAAGLDLVRYTLQPGYAGPIADAWSDVLPGNYLTGRRVVLALTHLTRGTILEQAQAYQIATGNKAWMLPSEVRADLFMPMDMSLDEAGAPAPALERIDA